MTRTDRLTAIILLLQDRPRTCAEIARQFEISRRTVMRDVQALCEIGVPVIARDGAAGGYSLPEDCFVRPLQLSIRELLLLLLALGALEKMPSVPYPKERSSLVAKLRALVSKPRLQEVERLAAHLAFDIPERAQQAPLLEDLLHAAQEGQWVQATYASPERTSSALLLPVQITCRNGLWYCEAYAHEHRNFRTYRVDRFTAVSRADPPSTRPPPMPEIAYDHPSHPEVVIRLTGRAIAEAADEIHLGRAVRRLPDGSAIWQFRCPPSELDWLARAVLRFGPEARVESPEELCDRVSRAAKEIFLQYLER